MKIYEELTNNKLIKWGVSLYILQIMFSSILIIIFGLPLFNVFFVATQSALLAIFVYFLLTKRFVILYRYSLLISLFSLLIISSIFSLVSLSYIEYGTIMINKIEDLNRINWNPSGNFKLNNDIFYDSSITNEEPCIIKEFNGIFDGNGYTIYDLNKPLFCTILDADIKNIYLRNVNINVDEYSVPRFGTIALINRGIIENVHVFGNISGSTSTGGLIGYNQGTINNSSFSGIIDSPLSSQNGGITSLNEGIISASYSKGSINGNVGVGGISGVSSGGSIVNCYTKMNINGNIHVSGIVGYLLKNVNLDGLIVYGNITANEYIGVVTSSDHLYAFNVLFTGQIYSSDYSYEESVFYSADQAFYVPSENYVDIILLDDSFYLNLLGLNQNIWAYNYENNIVLPYLSNNIE